jgi:glycosyltransferase involved in cell wall biosynthesis
LEKGEDVLVGAEFSCHFLEYDTKLHVLAYGFSPEQEVKLNTYRKNLYHFLTYTVENDIPTILPHPLYFYGPKSGVNPELFEKLALLFERFEVMNGQRDVWQNLLTWEWLNSITAEKIELWQQKHGITSNNFCKDILTKHICGGSDDHMGLFAGTCGSYLQVPGLEIRRQTNPLSQLALEAIREGAIHPFGSVANHEKLNVAFIDYLSQVALYMKDPGLLRMFLHHGSLREKLIGLGVSNMMQELRRHRFTMFFFKTLHEALRGKRPSLLSRFKISSEFKPMMQEIDEIAKAKDRDQDRYTHLVKEGIPRMFTALNTVMAGRIKTKTQKLGHLDWERRIDAASLISKFEIPTHFRMLFAGNPDRALDDVSQVNVAEFFDTLSFPALASAFIAGASLISSRVLMNQRKLVNGFAKTLGRFEHPERVLWLTDTLGDKNGVSVSLSAKLGFIQAHALNIDFLTCHQTLPAQPHLNVVRPVGSFSLPGYPDQMIHVPDLLEIKRVFIEGGYDRIICSTELLMGLVALFLKESLAVPVYFFMHTDWLEFFSRTTSLELQVIDRIRRMLRAFYLQFDGIFVMNQDHRNWLTGPAIGFEAQRIFDTAHWVDERFYPRAGNRARIFGNRIADHEIVVLYAGRISEEKGVFDLPKLAQQAKKQGVPIKLVIAGKGPAEDALKSQLPEALFLGWVDRETMPELYSQVDLLILPSRFDTFGNVILEAMSCGTAVAAYAEKGPKSIIKSKRNGILAQDLDDMFVQLQSFVNDARYRRTLKQNSLKRAKAYRPEQIMAALTRNIGLTDTAERIGSLATPSKAVPQSQPAAKRFKQAIGY